MTRRCDCTQYGPESEHIKCFSGWDTKHCYLDGYRWEWSVRIAPASQDGTVHPEWVRRNATQITELPNHRFQRLQRERTIQ